MANHRQPEAGEYRDHDDPHGPAHRPARCVRCLFEFSGDRLAIGRFCMIAEGARFMMNGGNRDALGFSTCAFGVSSGAGSVVPRDVRLSAVVAGHPAREARCRFDDGTVATLPDIAWRDWPVESIGRASPAIRRGSRGSARHGPRFLFALEANCCPRADTRCVSSPGCSGREEA